MAEISIGLIGCGNWGYNLLKNFNSLSGANVIFCCDLNTSLLQHITAIYPDIKTTPNCEELFNDREVDAVAIATPIATHFGIAKRALEKNKHVFVEKPMTSSSRQVSELIELAKRQKRILMVDHTFEYSPAVQAIKDAIKKRTLGAIYTIDMARLNLGRFQPDANVIWDLASHDLSILLYVLGEIPISVICTAGCHIAPDIEDDSHITLTFNGNKTAHIHVNWLNPIKVRQMTIVGRKKMLMYDDTKPTEKVIIYDRGISIKPMQRDTTGSMRYTYRFGDAQILKVADTEPLKLACQHFLACIRSGATPRSDGNSGLRVIKLIEDIHRSLKNSLPYTIPNDKEIAHVDNKNY